MKFKGFIASSSDPTGQTLSLTVESVSKVVIGVIGWIAVSKGLNPETAQSQLQAIIDIGAQLVPMGFAFYHTLMMGWGLVRKFYHYFFTSLQ